MTQAQIKYALKRLEEVYQEKLLSIRLDAFKEPSLKEMLLDGRATFTLTKLDKCNGTYSRDILDVPSFTSEIKADRETQESKKKSLHDKYVLLRDEFMLGDAEEALELLRKFKGSK